MASRFPHQAASYELLSRNTTAEPTRPDGPLPQRRAPSTLRLWRWEFVQIAVAVSIFAAIVALLAGFDKQQRPQWDFGLNLSTVIAVLATLLRASLLTIVEEVIRSLKWDWFREPRPLYHLALYEEASNGLWGSLAYLFTLPRLNIPTLATSITVVSLAISAFTQQALQTVACHRDVPGASASVPLARTLNQSLLLRTIATRDDDMDISDLPQNLVTAFVNGLGIRKGGGPPNNLPVACPSGNCTFPPPPGLPYAYATLAMASDCVDVSGSVRQTESQTESQSEGDGKNNNNNRNVTVYHIEGGPSLRYRHGVKPKVITALNGTSVQPRVDGVWSTAMNSTPLARDLSADGGSLAAALGIDLAPIRPSWDARLGDAAFILVNRHPCGPGSHRKDADDDDEGDNTGDDDDDDDTDTGGESCYEGQPGITGVPEGLGITAAVCWMYPGVQKLVGGVVNGRLEEAQVGEIEPLLEANGTMDDIYHRPTFHRDSFNMNPALYRFADPCRVGDRTYALDDDDDDPATWPPDLDVVNVSLPDRPGQQQPPGSRTQAGPRACLHGLSRDYVSNFGSFARQTLSGHRCQLSYRMGDVKCRSWWLRSLFNRGSATADSMRDSLAMASASMTNQMRASGSQYGGGEAQAEGAVSTFAVCTSFYPLWLIFPAALLALTLVVVGGVIVKDLLVGGAAAARPRFWKSSLLPLLFYGLDDKAKADAPVGEHELERRAKMGRFSFREQDGRWRFFPEADGAGRGRAPSPPSPPSRSPEAGAAEAGARKKPDGESWRDMSP